MGPAFDANPIVSFPITSAISFTGSFRHRYEWVRRDRRPGQAQARRSAQPETMRPPPPPAGRQRDLAVSTTSHRRKALTPLTALFPRTGTDDEGSPTATSCQADRPWRACGVLVASSEGWRPPLGLEPLGNSASPFYSNASARRIVHAGRPGDRREVALDNATNALRLREGAQASRSSCSSAFRRRARAEP